jgi:hypothetical protein
MRSTNPSGGRISQLTVLSANLGAGENAMRAILTTAMILSGTVALAEDHSGQYFCYRSNAAGLLRKDDPQTTFAGKIDLPPTRQKFFITIAPIKRDPVDIDACAKSTQRYMELLRAGRSYEDFDGNFGYDLYRRAFMGNLCFAKDTLKLKYPDGKSGQDFWSYDLQFEFLGAGPPETFSFYGSGDFQQVERFDGGGIVVSEGHCEKIVPPN